MAVQTVESVQRLAPYLEGLEKRLLQSAFGTFDGNKQTQKGLLDTAINLPQFRVAGLDPLQTEALRLAPEMFGSYAPFIRGAGQQAAAGTDALAAGLGMISDPRAAVDMYMNPYQDVVIDEINRQAAIGRQGLAAKADRLGAFGGSRYGAQEGEAEGRRLAAIGEAQRKGFDTALTASQNAANLLRGIGSAYGTLGATTADIGRVGSELGRADLGMLSQMGEIGRNYQSQVLEAQRQNQLQQTQEPFTRLQLGQQLLKGSPSSDLASTFRTAVTPSTNPFLAGVGAYTALQGVQSGNQSK